MIEREALEDIVRRIHLIPDRHRAYSHDTDSAWQRFRIDDNVVSALLDLGLPHQVRDGMRLFDRSDLANVSLMLRLPSGRFAMMRRWHDSLRIAAGSEPVCHRITLATPVDPSGHDTDAKVAEQLHPWLVSDGSGPNGPAVVNVPSLSPGTPLTADAFGELAGLIRTVEFFVLPVALRYDLGFLRETGLADCQLATHHLVAEAHSRGIRARSSFGLFLATPFSTTHTWPQVDVDGRWTSFDPHMLNSLAGWGLVDAEQWPPLTPVDRVLLRLGERPFPLLTQLGQAITVSLPTRRSHDVDTPMLRKDSSHAAP